MTPCNTVILAATGALATGFAGGSTEPQPAGKLERAVAVAGALTRKRPGAETSPFGMTARYVGLWTNVPVSSLRIKINLEGLRQPLIQFKAATDDAVDAMSYLARAFASIPPQHPLCRCIVTDA